MFRACLVACLAVVSLGASLPAPARDQGRSEQEELLRKRMQGHILPLRVIERRVIPTMGDAQYIGFSFDSTTEIYTLKFLRNGSVIWVDVDGRSGQIVRKSGR